jgi:tetratricopeptide (TPR) repeat protein
MSDQEATETFRKLLGLETPNSEVSRQLLIHFDNLPLAIAQAAAYIRETNITLLEYLNLFTECERNQQRLLGEALLTIGDKIDLEGSASASRAVMTTWKITVAKIEATSPDSVRLLEILSFLGPEEIPAEILKAGISFLQNDSFLLHKTVKPLLSFALLYCLTSSNYRIHRLVASSMRSQLGPEAKDELLETVLEFLRERFPQDLRQNMQTCRQLVPHAVAALEHTAVGHRHPDFKLHRNLQQRVADALNAIGDYRGALDWYQRALEGKEKTLGKDHPDTLSTVNKMAVMFQSQGDYGKALEWYQRALEGYEKTLGKEHPSTLGTVNNIAVVFKNQGDYGKALEWYQRALDGYEKMLGKDHPDTLSTVHNMAIVFQSQGDYGKALEWYQRALDIREKTLGKEHPFTLNTVNNMAIVFQSQGDYGKALEWYQRALDGREKTLGKDHPSTVGTVNNIALVFQSQGDYGKALEWYQRALDGREKTLGKDHPDTLSTVHNMAIVFQSQGDYGKALEWYQRALDGYKKTLGKDHPSTLRTLRNMTTCPTFSERV